ncbi:hypothetical protein C4A75_07785 [Brevibacillus laterosporus]|uniref:hypothetical protein n=1 Tax=Brevibacillus laterosporus TaxID=1465 RepID=UPI000CE382E2|nr:hypothetical protein [Brevibacillus laterosporus]PPA85560.1 hypothetical protein C4A75_07785 [Brevibacillus laterosporus]
MKKQAIAVVGMMALMLSATSPFSTVLAETVNSAAASKEKQTLHIDQVIAEINQKEQILIKLKKIWIFGL